MIMYILHGQVFVIVLMVPIRIKKNQQLLAFNTIHDKIELMNISGKFLAYQ